MRPPCIAKFVLLIGLASCSTPESTHPPAGFGDLSGPYFGLVSPGPVPQLFVPGLVSTEGGERTVCFLDEGRVCVIVRDHETVYAFVQGDRWTEPQAAPFSYGTDMMDCTAGPDGKTLYFMTSRPIDAEDTSETHHLWTTEWTGSSWAEARPLPKPEKMPGNGSGYPTATSDGTVYFISDARNGFDQGGIYRSRVVNGEAQPAKLVEQPINGSYIDFDPCVAPDESYILFNSNRPGGFGSWDTYVCFRQDSGGWTPPINLGRGFNSSASEACPTISSDGRYFFFISTRDAQVSKGSQISAPIGGRDKDTYWVDTSFIDDLRSRFEGTTSSAGIVAEEYRANGTASAIEVFETLYANHRAAYSFLPNDLLQVCEEMLSDGRVEDADQFYQAMVQVLPETVRIKLGYAVIVALNGDPGKGLELVREIERVDHTLDSEDIVLHLGRMLTGASRYTDARPVFEFAVQEFPRSHRPLYYLAVVEKNLGDSDRALRYCIRAQALAPENETIMRLRAQLEGQS